MAGPSGAPMPSSWVPREGSTGAGLGEEVRSTVDRA